jgi:hypothetical protein
VGLTGGKATGVVAQPPRTIVLFSPGLNDETAIWGEKIAVRSESRALQQEFPGAQVLAFDSSNLSAIAALDVDLLISYYTGPRPPWRVDEIAQSVSGITILKVVNHGDLIDEFARIGVDGFITNSPRAAEVLGRARPAAYVPLAVDDDFGPVEPVAHYRSDVVFLGSGGRGNKRPATTRHYLDPAKRYDFAIWGAYWDQEYWAPVYQENPGANDWYRFCRGPLPIDDIAKLYSSAKIVLNYHEDSQREWGMWNNRVFEALACGALLITDDAAGLGAEFAGGLITTAGGAETAGLIEHYLARPEERRRIGEAGRELTRRRYTYSRWARSVREFYERLVRAKERGN